MKEAESKQPPASATTVEPDSQSMFLLVVSLASLLSQPGAGAGPSEQETTRGLLYLLKYGYLSPSNQTAALSTPEGLQERQTPSSISSKIYLNYFKYLLNI